VSNHSKLNVTILYYLCQCQDEMRTFERASVAVDARAALRHKPSELVRAADAIT